MKNKWNAEKLVSCPIHGEVHTLSSGLCTDLGCIAKIIETFSKTWKVIARYWRRIKLGGLKDDFCVFVVQELLKEEKYKDKKPTLNPKWLIFRMKQYLYKDARESSLPEHMIPKFAKTKIQAGQLYYEDLKAKYEREGSADILDEIINEGFDNLGGTQILNPEQTIIFSELKQYIITNYGEAWFLYAIGSITHIDVAKLTGHSIREVTKLWNTIRLEIQKNYFQIDLPI
jgi:hypothetical protein